MECNLAFTRIPELLQVAWRCQHTSFLNRVFKGFIFYPWNMDNLLQLFVHKARTYFQGKCPISTESSPILKIMQQLQKQKCLRMHAKTAVCDWKSVKEVNIT